MVLLKITLVFILIVLLLRLKTPFSISILLAGLILGLGFNLGVSDIGRTAWAALQEPETISLALIVGIILVLSELLQVSGQMTELGQVIIKTFGLHRWTYTILPAIIGLLPMPGGALFTAPMMDGVSETNIPAHKKTLINYWFRHIWEYAWPLYPGLVLAAGLARVNLNTLSLIQSPFTVISALIGAALILPGIRISDEHVHKGSFRDFARMVYLISPIIVIILLFVVFHLNMLICISTGLAVAILNVLISRKLKITAILKVVFVKLSVYQMIFVVISVLIFTGIMRSSTLIVELSRFFTGGIDGNIPFVYMTVAIILLPFIVGLLTGLTVGFVGITFPLIFSTIVPNGIDVMPMAMLAYISGVSGVMLSPVHLCLVLTNQYYNSEFSKVYKTLIPVSLSVLLLAVSGFLLYAIL
ncbi:MAG: DUF401 family protein [Planctomycetes bacterium]|nr:DUF401 family protein [Planctomycetota bacterium]